MRVIFIANINRLYESFLSKLTGKYQAITGVEQATPDESAISRPELRGICKSRSGMKTADGGTGEDGCGTRGPFDGMQNSDRGI